MLYIVCRGFPCSARRLHFSLLFSTSMANTNLQHGTTPRRAGNFSPLCVNHLSLSLGVGYLNVRTRSLGSRPNVSAMLAEVVCFLSIQTLHATTPTETVAFINHLQIMTFMVSICKFIKELHKEFMQPTKIHKLYSFCCVYKK